MGISHYHYDSKEFFSSIVNLKNGGIAEFTNIQNNYFKLDYFTRLDKLNFLNEEEKTVFKSFFQNFNPSFKGEYLLSPPITELLDKSRTQEPPLSLLFITCDLRNEFKPEDFQSLEFLDLLYCQTMIN